MRAEMKVISMWVKKVGRFKHQNFIQNNAWKGFEHRTCIYQYMGWKTNKKFKYNLLDNYILKDMIQNDHFICCQ